MRKVLITGGAGFVGRHFTKRLLDHGSEVHVVDPVVKHTGGIHPKAGWPLYEPRDYAVFNYYDVDCRAFFQQHQDTDFDLVIHLAAMVGGRQMIENHPLVVAEDLSIDSAYWQWAEHCRPAKTVCFSSSAAYPIKYQTADAYQLLREDMIAFDDELGMPDMSYGWAKLTCEYLARLAFEKHGLKSVCYRPFSGYGEDQDVNYPFPSICKRVLAHKGVSSVQVWGTGSQMRDFIHISDCVDCVLKTMDKIDDGDAVNLSTGIYTSFINFIRLAAGICGYAPEIVPMSTMPTGVHARAGDTQKQRDLGFTSSISLKTGITRALEYYSIHAPD